MCILMLPVLMVANSRWLHLSAGLLRTASLLLEAMTEAWPELGRAGTPRRTWPLHTGLVSIDRGKPSGWPLFSFL